MNICFLKNSKNSDILIILNPLPVFFLIFDAYFGNKLYQYTMIYSMQSRIKWNRRNGEDKEKKGRIEHK